jgi:L-aspartate oxidase
VNVLRADVIIVGSGVAGSSVALGLGLANSRDVLIIEDGDGSTRWAQGGIAVAFGDDRPTDHAADTNGAGAGRCDPDAVRRLVEEGPLRVAELIARGAQLDRGADGRLLRSREGGHRQHRVVHAGGDATGAEVWRVLHEAVGGVRRLRARVIGMRTSGNQVTGVVAEIDDGIVEIAARAVVLATGGLGHVYGATTNPVGVTGAGFALADLVGARLSNMEFVQFHPTALATGTATGQLPLITEALRGAGAILLDDRGTAFMRDVHPMADLAPRDVVAAAVFAAMDGRENVWLDCRVVPDVRRRFPTVTAACEQIGVDPARDLVPVRPAEHFSCGGITTDAWGATSVRGLYAVGEVADTGVHGANRLASNSLLEGLVYGARVAAALTLDLPDEIVAPSAVSVLRHDPMLAAYARTITDAHAGIVRTPGGLAEASRLLAPLADRDATCRVALAVIEAAASRPTSVGCHRIEELVGAAR